MARTASRCWTLALCCALGLPGIAAAQAASAPAAKLARADVDFMKKAAEGGLAEVEGSKLAVDKAVNTQVKGFAQQMVDDHGKANEALKALAARKGVELPTEPSMAQRASLHVLHSADGAAFDRRYADALGVDAHRDTVRLFQKAATSAADPDVKAFAGKLLPTLQHHLEMATEMKRVTEKEGNAKAPHDRKQ
jgi:putative membrane protein